MLPCLLYSSLTLHLQWKYRAGKLHLWWVWGFHPYRIRLLCQLFPTLSALSLDWRYGWADEAKNSLGLFQPRNGLPISLQPWRGSCVDACYLQTTAVCQRYDYVEWHRYIRDFNLSSHSIVTKMALFSFIYLRSYKEWRDVKKGKEEVIWGKKDYQSLFSKQRMRPFHTKHCLCWDIFKASQSLLLLKRLNSGERKKSKAI